MPFRSTGQAGCQDYSICIEKPNPDYPEFHIILEMPAGGLTGIRLLNIVVGASNGTFIPAEAMQLYDIPGVIENFNCTTGQASYSVLNFPAPGFDITGTRQTLFKVTTDGQLGVCVQVDNSSFTRMIFESSMGQFCFPASPTCSGFSNEHCFAGITISGLLETVPPQGCNFSFNNGLPGATVAIIGIGGGAEYNQSLITGPSGEYSFLVEPGHLYTVVPSKTYPLSCGVTTEDMALVQGHIIGGNTLDSHQKLVAADVNQDDYVSTADAILIKEIILEVPLNGGPYLSWDFVAYTHYTAFNAAPSPVGTSNIPVLGNIIVRSFNADASQQDFLGIKIGDVNGSCADCGTDELVGSGNNHPALAVNFENVALQKGEERIIPVRIQGIENASVIAMGMQLDQKMLSILEVIPGDLDHSGLEDFNLTRLHQGELRFLWFSQNVYGALPAENEAIFYLRLRANDDMTNIAPFIRLNDALMENRAYKGPEVVHPLVLEAAPSTRLYQAVPNPFGATGTTIRFYLPADDLVTMALYDASGMLVEQRQLAMQSGSCHWQIGDGIALPQGAYHYSITGGNARYSGKLIKL